MGLAYEKDASSGGNLGTNRRRNALNGLVDRADLAKLTLAAGRSSGQDPLHCLGPLECFDGGRVLGALS